MHIIESETLRDRAMDLPLGLTVKQAANLLGESIEKTRAVLKEIHYIVKNRRKEPWSEERKRKMWRVDWSKVDWTQRDLDLARHYGVSRQIIYRRRKQLT